VQEQTSKLLETSAIQNKAEYHIGEDEVIRINNQNEAQLQSKKNIVRRCGLVFYVSLHDRVGGTDKDVITRIIRARAPENWGWIRIKLPENSSKTSTFRAKAVRRKVAKALRVFGNSNLSI
jgi:hypothetical protein